MEDLYFVEESVISQDVDSGPSIQPVDDSVRRSGRARKPPMTKFRDMEVTLKPVIKSATTKHVPNAELENAPAASTSLPGKKKRRSVKSNLWLHKPKNVKIEASDDAIQDTIEQPEIPEAGAIVNCTSVSMDEIAPPTQEVQLLAQPETDLPIVNQMVVVEESTPPEPKKVIEHMGRDGAVTMTIRSISEVPADEMKTASGCDSVINIVTSKGGSKDSDVTCENSEISMAGLLQHQIQFEDGGYVVVSLDPATVGAEKIVEAISVESDVKIINASIEDNDGNSSASDAHTTVTVPSLDEISQDEVTPEKELGAESETKDVYRCQFCEYTTTKRGNWYKHKVMHSEMRRYACPDCGYKAKTSSNLQRHRLIHSGAKKFKCEECEQTFRQKIHLQRHIDYKHSAKSVQCPLCDFMCATMSPGLTMHLKRKHQAKEHASVHRDGGRVVNELHVQPEVLLSCSECGLGPMNKKDHVQHMKLHKSGPEIKYFCELCSFVTNCKSRLDRHSLTHSKRKPFMCGACTYRATQKVHVLRHIRAKHGIEIASNTRKSKENSGEDASQEKKQRYGSGGLSAKEKHFVCNFCTMKFTKLINLHKHVSVQHKDLYGNGESNAFSCVLCNYVSNNRSNLLVHMRKHSFQTIANGAAGRSEATNVFSCVLCDFSSQQRAEVHAHMKTEHKVFLLNEADAKSLQAPTSGESTEAGKTVIVQLAPGGPTTSVSIESPKTSEPVKTDNHPTDSPIVLDGNVPGEVIELMQSKEPEDCEDGDGNLETQTEPAFLENDYVTIVWNKQ